MSITLKNAVKRYGNQPVVDGVSVTIAAGEFFVVLGPSGCGKSTLLRLISGLEPLDGGEIALGGTVVSGAQIHTPPEERRVGMVFQSYALWPHMSVRENVAFPAQSLGVARAEAVSRADAHLETVAMTEFAGRAPADLSGGQRQRVALARCLAGEAQTILMDEPLANLDPHLRGHMEQEIAAFHKRTGSTTIYITHDQREAMTLADRIAVMWQGQFLQIGTPQDIHDRPASAQVARFIGRAAVLHATCSGGWADLGPMRVPLIQTVEGACDIAIRASHVEIGRGSVTGKVTALHFRGESWEGGIQITGLAEPLPFTSATPVQIGDEAAVSVRQAWAMPKENRP